MLHRAVVCALSALHVCPTGATAGGATWEVADAATRCRVAAAQILTELRRLVGLDNTHVAAC